MWILDKRHDPLRVDLIVSSYQCASSACWVAVPETPLASGLVHLRDEVQRHSLHFGPGDDQLASLSLEMNAAVR
jgi:hypothetical protein